jgi:small subunit ribosomal protein S16
MSVALRLYRLGKKHHPVYRAVAMNKRDKRNGAYIEVIGFYNPMTSPHTFQLDKKRFAYWRSRGASISEGLAKLLRRFKKD